MKDLNTELLEKGCKNNDKLFAKNLRKIADKLEQREIGAIDAFELVNEANTQHTIICELLVDTLMKED